MIGRPVRIALLALAAWAVVFAPGAAGNHDDAPVAVTAEDVAAAIIAPTFGPDGVVLARSVRDSTDELGDALSGPFLLGLALVVVGGWLETTTGPATAEPILRSVRCSLAARAPPMA